jgi:pyridoxamine 5'-phosphate oxidase
MTLAPWQSAIAYALHRNRSLIYSRYIQLATVQENGRPANRVVVFRGFWENTNQIKFITDSRSEKIKHIQYQPWAEVCWYFPKTREQFRIGGSLTLVNSDTQDPILQEGRHLMWQQISEAARSQFAWPHPGKARVEDKKAFEASTLEATKPSGNFCLLLLNPEEVDHLELKGEPQNRKRYFRNQHQDWSMQELNP